MSQQPDRGPADADDLEIERRVRWTAFRLLGHWVRGTAWQPTSPGRYFVADRHGTYYGLRDYRTDAARGRVVQAGVGPNESGWQGWIWDVPLPDAPAVPVPDWEE